MPSFHSVFLLDIDIDKDSIQLEIMDLKNEWKNVGKQNQIRLN